MRAASLGLQCGISQYVPHVLSVCPHAPGRLQIDGVDEFWDTLILGDLVRARAESLDPVSDG